MSVKTIIGTYSSGYDLNVTKGDNGVDILTIASTGYVGGSGVLASGAYFGGTAYTIANNGKLSGSNAGVYMDVQGAVTNGAAGDLGGLIVGE